MRALCRQGEVLDDRADLLQHSGFPLPVIQFAERAQDPAVPRQQLFVNGLWIQRLAEVALAVQASGPEHPQCRQMRGRPACGALQPHKGQQRTALHITRPRVFRLAQTPGFLNRREAFGVHAVEIQQHPLAQQPRRSEAAQYTGRLAITLCRHENGRFQKQQTSQYQKRLSHSNLISSCQTEMYDHTPADRNDPTKFIHPVLNVFLLPTFSTVPHHPVPSEVRRHRNPHSARAKPADT